jgi:hypothetical protein
MIKAKVMFSVSSNYTLTDHLKKYFYNVAELYDIPNVEFLQGSNKHRYTVELSPVDEKSHFIYDLETTCNKMRGEGYIDSREIFTINI